MANLEFWFVGRRMMCKSHLYSDGMLDIFFFFFSNDQMIFLY